MIESCLVCHVTHCKQNVQTGCGPCNCCSCSLVQALLTPFDIHLVLHDYLHDLQAAESFILLDCSNTTHLPTLRQWQHHHYLCSPRPNKQCASHNTHDVPAIAAGNQCSFVYSVPFGLVKGALAARAFLLFCSACQSHAAVMQTCF